MLEVQLTELLLTRFCWPMVYGSLFTCLKLTVVVKPAVVHLACAVPDAVLMKFGTVHGGGGGGGGGGPCVTVTDVVVGRQSFGDEAGLVVWPSTVSPFWPLGLNEPLKPSDDHLLRAAETSRPTRLGTFA